MFAYDDSKFFVLTKGDNNRVHDRSLYSSGQEWLMEGDVIGRVYGLALGYLILDMYHM